MEEFNAGVYFVHIINDHANELSIIIKKQEGAARICDSPYL